MRSSGRNKDRITQTLDDRITRHTILFVKSATQFPVQVPTLVVNRVVVDFETVAPFEGNLIVQSEGNG
jgi:hypothetical protein